MPIPNPEFKEKSIIIGGNEGILGESNSFCGKNTTWI
jgi:hypothetical protein